MSEIASDQPAATGQDGLGPAEKKIIHRLGGRHLIFRLKKNRWRFVPKPYVLVSSIAGPLWVFYGIGQVFLTHKKVKQIRDWTVRAPRFVSKRLLELVNRLQPEIEKFIDYCNEQDLTATLVIERRVIELHWTPRKDERQSKDDLDRREINIDEHFYNLAQKFVDMQLVEPADV